MKSPVKELLQGALLGDVVEALTGGDLRIDRSPAIYSRGRYSHTTRAFLGDMLLGTATVTWNGDITSYKTLLKVRMKVYLRQQKVLPVIVRHSKKTGLLHRHFALKTLAGELSICETLFTKRIATVLGGSK